MGFSIGWAFQDSILGGVEGTPDLPLRAPCALAPCAPCWLCAFADACLPLRQIAKSLDAVALNGRAMRSQAFVLFVLF